MIRGEMSTEPAPPPAACVKLFAQVYRPWIAAESPINRSNENRIAGVGAPRRWIPANIRYLPRLRFVIIVRFVA